jgi:hypothetical protein
MKALSKDSGPAFGVHAFIWAGEWTREGAERVISGAAEVDLDFVGIPLLDPGSIDVEHTRSLLDRYGLGCSCSLGLPTEVHLPSNPEGARRFLDGVVARRGRGPRRSRSGRVCLPAREGERAWCALLKENRSSRVKV